MSERKTATPTEYVWIVQWGNYYPSELFGIYSTKQMAQAAIEENAIAKNETSYSVVRYRMNVWNG